MSDRMGDTVALLEAPAAAAVLTDSRAAGTLEQSTPAAVQAWHVGVWLAVLGLALAAALTDGSQGWLASWSGHTAPIEQSALVLLLLALACEFVDATIGMGYGTTLTPILIVLGYPVSMIVPAALLSQLLANISAAFFHHKTGNFDFWNDHQTRNTGLLMGGVGLVVSIVAMQVALQLPDRYLRTAITVMVIGIGLFMLLGSRLKLRFRMRNVGILAGLAAFNKAFSGGGFGPLVCGGQVLVGLPVRSAVASTAVAEAIVCTAAVASYYASGNSIPLFLLLPLLAGALLSTPLSALTLRRLPQGLVKRLMAIAILLLAAYALWQGKGI